MNNPILPKQQPDLQQLFQQFKQNPAKYLGIPDNINTPQQAVEYLVSSGKIPPQLRGRVSAMLGRKI